MSRSVCQGYLALIAAALVSSVLGSIHAFSVFLEPLEAAFAITRATASLTYSIGLVCLTGLVLFGPVIYAKFRPTTIFLGVSVLGAVGAVLAGYANNIATIWTGYGVIFGAANGLGYGFGLQFAARANPAFPGLAMGIITAAYALGAVSAPYGFQLALSSGGFKAAMLSLSATVFATGLLAALLISLSRVRYSTPEAQAASSRLPFLRIVLIWISYGTAVFAGLMAISQAASMALATGFTGWIAPAVLAFFNLIGSLLSGWLVDRISHRWILVTLPLISAVSLVAITLLPELTLVFLCIVGFAYGGIIATYPAAISRQFSGDDGPRVYGRVFTAWGTAGLLAPWIAGRLFDYTGDYDAALWIASALAFLSALVVIRSVEPGPCE